MRMQPKGGETFVFPKMHEHQRVFATTKARFPLSLGGMGSGKSLALIMRTVCLLIDTPYFGNMAGNVGILGRDTLKNLKRTTMADFFEFCPPEFIKHFDKQDSFVDFNNGSRLYFVHFEVKNDFRSMNLGFAAFDQIEDIPESVWEEISIHRLRRTEGRIEGNSINFHTAFGVANPCSNWVSQIWQANELKLESKDSIECSKYDSDYLVVHSKVTDNAEHLPPDFILNMEKKYSKDKKKAQMFMNGEWGALEGSTYNWDNNLVLDENKIPAVDVDVVCMLDHGVTAPKALLWVALVPQANGRTKLHVFDELYEREMGVAEFVGLIDERLKWHALQRGLRTQREAPLRYVNDPAMAQAIEYTDKRRKITILDTYHQRTIERGFGMNFFSGCNDVITGIDKVNWLFDNLLVEINPKCTNFIREHKGLLNDPEHDGKPKKGQDDHCCTAFIYGISTMNFLLLFPKLMEEKTDAEKKIARFRQRARIKKVAHYEDLMRRMVG